MTAQRVLVLSAAVIAVSTTAAYAGPCSDEIGNMQARLDARLEANAAAGPTAPESSSATMHRQPTPGAVASVESRLGELSPQAVEAVAAAMARALEAGRAADKGRLRAGARRRAAGGRSLGQDPLMLYRVPC
jgi:hypothetical protein